MSGKPAFYPDYPVGKNPPEDEAIERLTALAEVTFGASFDQTYGNHSELVLGNVCFFFRNGLVVFNVHRRDDLEKIREATEHLRQFEAVVSGLSPRARLDFRGIVDRVARKYGASGRKPGSGYHPVSPLDVLREVMPKLERMHRLQRAPKRLDWYSAAVAKDCAKIWTEVTGKPAPNSVHHDALGPFGEFLQGTLEIVCDVYRPSRPPSSASSAMRALAAINRM